MKKQTLHDKVYMSKRSGNVYPLSHKGTIDLDNAISVFDVKKYAHVGHNNQFDIYELKITKHKK